MKIARASPEAGFIANLGFPSEPGIVNASKMAILLASLISGIIGFAWLKFAARERAVR